MRTGPFAALFAATLLATGCASGPGSAESGTPPAIVVNKEGQFVWDRPGAFGPVPADKAEMGKAICGSLDTTEHKHIAKGYHSFALDAKGNRFQNGGFYCVRQ